MNKTTYILPVLMILFLVSCAKDDIVDKPSDERAPISFDISTSRETRATEVGLEEYVKSFRVYGVNGKVEGGSWKTAYNVFDNYEVHWIENSASTTASNTHNWEYVGYGQNQTIKYWDDNQESHYFWAVADKDKGSFNAADGFVTFNDETDGRVKTFTCNYDAANATDAGAFFYSKICKVDKVDYGKPVKLEFIPYLCRVRIGFYETVPGYVVNNLKVNGNDDVIVNSEFVKAGNCILTYDYDNNKITTQNTPSETQGSQNFGAVQYQTLIPRIGTDEDGLKSATAEKYLARSSDNASFALGGGVDKNYYLNMFPYEDRNTPLTLKCSYMLTDPVSGSQIPVADVKVTVPVEYAKWEPGYEYTYIFKISSVASTEFDLDVYVKKWNEEEIEHPLHNW